MTIVTTSTRIQLSTLHLNHHRSRWPITAFLNSLTHYWDHCPTVTLDLSNCTFLNAEGAAILAAFILHRREWGGRTEADWNTGSNALKRQLGRWQLTELLGRQNFPWPDNAMPLFHQTWLDGEAVVQYISSVIRAGDNMPAMTPDLLKETKNSLCELFVNVFEHARSSCGGLAIGQYYPNIKQAQFCVCDVGLGLAEKVQKAGHALDCCGNAIRWALEMGNTTKLQPGGLGLYLLREFVKVNRGSLRILANTGYYTQGGAQETAQSLSVSYPGTLILVELLLRPDEVYTISGGKDL